MKLLKACLCLSIILLNMDSVRAQKFNLLIGTYTKNSSSEGFYVYEFDAASGDAVYKNKAAAINPSYLSLSSDEQFIYAVNELDTKEESRASAFSFDKSSGGIKTLNSVPAEGGAPCYIITDKAGRYAVSANYSGGNFSVFPILEDGSLGKAVQVVQHQGNSVNKQRQEKPHVHSTVFSPDEKYLFVCDLGTDKIMVYRYDPDNSSKPFSPAEPPFTSIEPGAGPRHLVFHPNKKTAYVIEEMAGKITGFTYEDGQLKAFQTISLMADGYTGNNGAAAVKISPDGRFLYGSNRGDADEITIYAVDKKNGRLTLAGRQSTLGKGPRDFSIDPSGNYLLAANQNSNNIIIFKRNKESGLLTDTGKRISLGKPVCLVFAGE